MKQTLIAHCDCCGLSVDPQTTVNCPRCNYPVNPDKEEHFLESAINDLQRVARYGGGNMKVDDLIRRYQFRLHHLKALNAPVAVPIPVAPLIVAQPPNPVVLGEAKIALQPSSLRFYQGKNVLLPIFHRRDRRLRAVYSPGDHFLLIKQSLSLHL